ncbi:MAG: FHA domain-containing protein, partial [Thermoanaerobaculia bacterium]|nr:FHA domain-containing protein [Thermoanaerobaculia bacterium]
MSGGESILDMLVVGGGPSGTAAAFRASELELNVAVIDYDDLMKRIRDYSKDKLILPSFGGGDRMAFPAGGELISSLCFAPIDKDELCHQWKKCYEDHGVVHHVGVELTGMERRDDGVWRVQTWNHNDRKECQYLARHVVIGIGRGVPRRFDIPGNTDGIAFRLTDAAQFIGEPACVIGGGTSAAEAVIAISQAKVEADDRTEVFWSYRGDKMPRVSKALSEVFFETYVGNGNIRYYRRSEPVAVVTGDDKEEYLAVRVDRRVLNGRPVESSLLEFPKRNCIACIGEDLPEELLGGFGIRRVEGGPKVKKRMVVNRYLETVQPNIYLIGDLLSQAYLETDDFHADPGTFRDVQHRGNIKSALRDGVLVAQVVRQRLDGATTIDTTVEDGVLELQRSSAIALISGMQDVRDLSDIRGTSAGALVQVLRDGVQGEEYPLRRGSSLTIGRVGCGITIPDDSLLSSQHATVEWTAAGVTLKDDGGVTGVFFQAPPGQKQAIEVGTLISVGQQFLVLDGLETPELIHYNAAGEELQRIQVTEAPRILGRDAPDCVLDGSDKGLSRRHLSVSFEGGKVLVKDLKSMNGTYLRVSEAVPLEHGSRFRVGGQLFAVRLDPDAVLDTSPPPPARRSSMELPAVDPGASAP